MNVKKLPNFKIINDIDIKNYSEILKDSNAAKVLIVTRKD